MNTRFESNRPKRGNKAYLLNTVCISRDKRYIAENYMKRKREKLVITANVLQNVLKV